MANQSSGAKTCFTVGCSILVGMAILIYLSASGNGSFIPFFIIAAAAVGVIVLRNREKNNTSASAGNVYDPRVGQVPRPISQPVPAPGVMKNEFETAICEHSFGAEAIKGKERIVCPCGFEFEVAMLREYAKLRKQVVQAQNDLDAVWRELQKVRNNPRVSPPRPQEAASRPTTPRPAVQPLPRPTLPEPKAQPRPVPVAKPVEMVPVAPVVKRAKVAISLQQWLIFAASFLVMVAGSAFVQQYVSQGADPSFYLLATVPLGVGAGFMAFWGRKISVILSNFMATLSSSMFLATLIPLSLIAQLGVQGGQFYEFSSPVVWPTLLMITSMVSLFLSKFKGNFGWKVISLITFIISMLWYLFGPIKDASQGGNFGWFAAISTAAGVVLALLNKALKTFTYDLSKVKAEDLDYEKDLVKREDNALERFTRVATAAFGILGVGYTALSFVQNFAIVDPTSFSVFALVWIAAGAIQKVWIDGLASDEKVQDNINRWVHIVGFTALGLAVNSWFKSSNLWVGLSSTVVLAFVGVILGAKVKRVMAHPVAVRVAHLALPVSWLAWELVKPEAFDQREFLLAGGVLLIAFALSLMLQHWFKFDKFASTAGTISHVVGLALFAFSVKTTEGLDVNTMSYAFTVLAILLLAVLYSPLTGLIAKRHEVESDSTWHYLIMALTGVLTFALVLPKESGSVYPISLVMMLGVSALAVGSIGQLAKGALEGFRKLLQSYGYMFQGLIVFLIFSSAAVISPAEIAVTLLTLSAVNYAFSFLGKDKIALNIAYVLGNLGLLVTMYAQKDTWLVTVHLGVSLLLVMVLNLLQFYSAKRAEAKYISWLFLGSSLLVSLASITINYSNWIGNDVQWIGLAELGAVALISAGIAERAGSGMLFRINALAYLFLSYITFAWWGTQEESDVKKLVVSALFAAVAFRQLTITSKDSKKNLTNIWFLVSYVGPIFFSLVLMRSSYSYLATVLGEPWIEIIALPLAIALSIPTFFNRSIPKEKRAFTALDIPYLVLMGGQAVLGVGVMAGVWNQQPFEMGLLRAAGALGLIAIFAYWRSMAEKQVRWVYLGYVTGGIGGLFLAHYIQTQLVSIQIPEIYSLMLSSSIVVGSFFLAKRIEIKETIKQLVTVDIPVLVPVVFSLMYSTSQGLDVTMNLIRFTLSIVLFTAYAHYKLGKVKIAGWVVATYIGLVGSFVSSAILLNKEVAAVNNIPELFSVAIGLAVLLGNLEVRRVFEFKTSLISIGLPMAALLFPSIFYAYKGIALQPIPVEDVTRLVAAVVIGLVALILGIRNGNLGAALSGGIAVGLVVIPITWTQADKVQDEGSSVSLKALVIAMLLFAIFSLLRRSEKVPTTSYLYIGVPVAVGLLPSLYYSLIGLGSSEPKTVDWIRFGIVVGVSVVLLVVGALRELGGMFFPGLVGILVGVLPYAFRQVYDQAWFLWVILLVIAGIMVWIAVRLEQMRKVGKSSISWIKALK